MLCYLGNNDKEKIDTCSGHMHLNFPHICKDLKNIVLYIYIYGCFAYMYVSVYHLRSWCPEEGVGYLGTDVIDSCELTYGCWDLNSFGKTASLLVP